MAVTSFHAELMAEACEKILGCPQPGSMAYIRCLPHDVVGPLSEELPFTVAGWEVHLVTDESVSTPNAITADQAVEFRETKGVSVLLLVDTARAGAGMDGIYSAAREITEPELFDQAIRMAAHIITKRLGREHRLFAERAIKTARRRGRRSSVSPWAEFDFLARSAADVVHPGALLHLIGLWPAKAVDAVEDTTGLDLSERFVERLLNPTSASPSLSARIDSLRLQNPTDDQRRSLESFLRTASTRPLLEALAELRSQRSLWVHALKVEGPSSAVQRIELVSWRTRSGQLAKWSGLVAGGKEDAPPEFLLRLDALKSGQYSKLEVRWKARPENLEEGCVDYRVAVVTDMDEELAVREVTHSSKKEEKCRFTNDDFSALSDDALLCATIRVSVIGNEEVVAQESEEFMIRYGEPHGQEKAGVGRKVRALSEGLIELDNKEMVTGLVSGRPQLPVDSKDYVLFRIPHGGMSFRVYQPPLIQRAEHAWNEHQGAIGRWRLRVRASGAMAGDLEFVPMEKPADADTTLWGPQWDRVEYASRRFSDHILPGGSVGQVYDIDAKPVEAVVKEYLLAWAALIEASDSAPHLTLAHTVEVQSLSGATIGLIVLPTHPLRVAWHVAYDNLVLHARYGQSAAVKDIRQEFRRLDGSMFPAFLPGTDKNSTFVFGDTLGFHAVGMIPDRLKEPKAALAVLARVLGDSESADSAPTVGRQSADILGREICKYVECHELSRLMHVHALRPGDGLTVARALGVVARECSGDPEVIEDEDDESRTLAFVLDLHPSEEQRGVAGRFISEVREKRRSGAGSVSAADSWMLESLALPGGIRIPRLQWARRDHELPRQPAHVAVAFDSFDSEVTVLEDSEIPAARPLSAFGLMSFLERKFTSQPVPLWCGFAQNEEEGEKHPGERGHTERLLRLHTAIQRSVARHLGGGPKSFPMLRTQVSPEKADSLKTLHKLCDWVITVDRNAGIEYFDSPRDNREIFDAYVIDCVPEREDLGCLQLITSTSSLDEVRSLLDRALDQMGLSRSRRNAEFLLGHLKALSGRLAIRLTGQKPSTGELIALAMLHAQCRTAPDATDSWVSLKSGFLVPVDDVQDLLPPVGQGPGKEAVDQRETRPDLIHVSLGSRNALVFRFLEVKYRRHLRAVRNPADLEGIRGQTEGMRRRWEKWYFASDSPHVFRAVRVAALARVLRFYADKALRHYLDANEHAALTAAIDRMLVDVRTPSMTSSQRPDRGYVFCPEYAGREPLEISPADWDTRIFLFGPGLLPDVGAHHDASRDLVPDRRLERKGETDSEDLPDEKKQPLPDSDGTAGTDRADDSSTTGTDGTETGKTTPDQPSESGILLGSDTYTSAPVIWRPTITGHPHLLIVGLSGMGKTTCLINICHQLWEQRICPIIFSYHEDIDQRLEPLLGKLRFVDYDGLGFNPLSHPAGASRCTFLDVAGEVRDIFTAIFPELGDIQAESLRQAVKDSFLEMGWNASTGSNEGCHDPQFGRFVEILRATPKKDKGLLTLLARLDELADYGLFSTGDQNDALWNSPEPVIVRVHSTQNENMQRAFASLLFYGLYKQMFYHGPQDRLRHFVVFDEAHRAARLRLIPRMAQECRKYGIGLVLASQQTRDFHNSLFSLIANYLVLRLTDLDAKTLVRNVTASDQERALIDRLKQMPKHRALFFSEGQQRPSQLGLQPPRG